MKKQLIAKLLVFGMVLAMLPATALALTTGTIEWDSEKGVYYVTDDAGNKYYDFTDNGNGTYTYEPDTKPTPDPDPDPTPDPDPDPTPDPDPDPDPTPDPDPEPDDSNTPTTPTNPTTPSTPATDTEPVVVETIDDVKTETNEQGQTVVTATIKVEDATAPVAVSESAVEAIVSQAKEGDVVALVAETTGAVTAPATQLAKLIETTGNPVSLGNSVAAVAVNATLAELAGGAEVKVEPVKNEDGTISVPVTAGGKVIAPEDVPGGIDVEVPVQYAAEEVAGVVAVKADSTEVELTWSITLGKLQVNLTVTGSIKIVLN